MLLKRFERFDMERHLHQRGIDVTKTRTIIDHERKDVYFFLYNLSGELIGYHKYNPLFPKKTHENPKLAKYFTHTTKEGDGRKIAVWGLETYNTKLDYIFVVEGLFDAARIHEAGYPALATLCNNPSESLISWLATLPQKIIVIYDNDAAGQKLKKVGDYAFSTDKGKDMNDLTPEEAKEFLSGCLEKIGIKEYINEAFQSNILNATSKYFKSNKTNPLEDVLKVLLDKYSIPIDMITDKYVKWGKNIDKTLGTLDPKNPSKISMAKLLFNNNKYIGTIVDGITLKPNIHSYNPIDFLERIGIKQGILTPIPKTPNDYRKLNGKRIVIRIQPGFTFKWAIGYLYHHLDSDETYLIGANFQVDGRNPPEWPNWFKGDQYKNSWVLTRGDQLIEGNDNLYLYEPNNEPIQIKLEDISHNNIPIESLKTMKKMDVNFDYQWGISIDIEQIFLDGLFNMTEPKQNKRSSREIKNRSVDQRLHDFKLKKGSHSKLRRKTNEI